MKVYETMATSVDIKDIQGNIILSTPINEGSKRKFTLQKEDYVTLKFSLDDPIYFKLGYWIDTDFGLFELVDLYKPNYNQSTAGYDYELRLDAYYWKWKNKKLKYSPESAAKETSFNLTATLDVHAGIVLRNLSALGYKYRGVNFTFSIDSTVENKPFLMTYDNINILDACFQMANSAGCECWVTDNIIHFGRCEFGDPVDFELGVNVDTMKRSDSQTEYSTRIIAFGSTRNIPTNYRPTDDSMIVAGVVQKRLMLPVGTSYVDAYENMAEEEAVEDVVVFDDVYPRRIGTMSGVTTKQYIDKIENADGTTTSEVWNAYRFKDSINFSKDYVISGQDLKIKFESGLLNGMEFGVTFNPDGKPEKINGDWNPEAQIWEIVRNSDYGVNLPNDTLKPVNGDKFVLSGFDITFVSDTYIPLAEQELLQKAQEYVAKTKIDPSTYDNKMMSGGTLYEVGDRVNLINPGYFENGRVSRIIGFEYNLDIPTDSPIYTVGETAAYSRIGDIEEKLETITYKSQTYTGTGGNGIYIIRTNDSTIASNNNVMSALRTINEILQRSVSKTNPDTANKLITFIEGLISQGLIEAKGGIRLPSGAALYSLYENGLLSFSMDENGFVIYEKGTANKWSVITSAGAEFQNLVIKFLAQITDLEVSNKATTLDLVVQALAKTHDLTVDNTADIMHGIIREYLTSESFVSGFLGSGFKIWKDANGDWNGEFDKLTVRKIFTIFELVVQKVVHQGGQVIRSAAGGKLVKVTDGGSYWKCEHDSTDDFLLDDQVLCQTFTGTSIKRYWRKVTSAGAGYFNLSKTDCEDGSANPEVGDNVAVLGNRTNTDRQSAQIDCAVGVNAPYRDDYAGINSYSLEGKLVCRSGNCAGIVDDVFGALDETINFYGKGVRLRGSFALESSGKLVEDELNDQITAVQTAFEIREGQIITKVQAATTAATQASGYATSAQGSASTATTKATEASNSANAAAGSATAAQDAADDAATVLSQVTTKETSINQTAEAIELKAVRAESAAGRAENAEASINLKADGIVLQASSQAAQQAVNGVQVGGRNYIRNSRIVSLDGWTSYNSTLSIQDSSLRVIGNNQYVGVRTDFSNAMDATREVTVSFYCKNNKSVDAFIGIFPNGNSDVSVGTIPGNSGWVKLSRTYIPSNYQVDKYQSYTIYIYSSGDSDFQIKLLKIEYGNKATDWTPAPEDVEADAQTKANTAESNAKSYADSTFTTKTEFSSQLTILSNSISAKVSQTDFNSLSTRVSSAEQKITSDAIISTVSSTITTAKNEAINAAAADATTKADAAKSSAVSTAATDATTKANTAESNAKTYSNNTFTPLTTYNTKIAQLESSISLKADSITVNGINTRLSSAEAKITPDAINLTVKSQITTAVDAVQIGGRNYIRNSRIVSLDGWTSFNSTLSMQDNSLRVIGNNQYVGVRTDFSNAMDATREVTVSFYCKNNKSVDAFIGIFPNGNSDVSVGTIPGNSGWVKLSRTYIPANYQVDKYQSNTIYIYSLGDSDFQIKSVKIEYGTKSTDWSEAPEDVDASIALRPTTEEIKSQFTIDSSGISMMGKKIALTGLITFSSLASDAQTKITTAQSTAESALTNAGTANLSIGTLQNSLRAMAYQDMVSLAKLDSTIVEGGYIKTSLIDANAIITGSLLATKIAATDITTNRLTIGAGARIGDLYIYDGGLNTNQQGLVAMGENYMGLSRSALSLFYNNYSTQGAGWSRYLSARVAPGSLSVKCVTTNSNFTDPGLQIEVSGNTDNTAINLIAGYVAGFALKTRVVYSTTTLTHADCYVSCYNTSDITVYLPSNPQLGKQMFIRRGNYNVTLAGNGKTLHWGNGTGTTRTRLDVGDAYFCQFDGIYWCINYIPK